MLGKKLFNLSSAEQLFCMGNSFFLIFMIRNISAMKLIKGSSQGIRYLLQSFGSTT